MLDAGHFFIRHGISFPISLSLYIFLITIDMNFFLATPLFFAIYFISVSTIKRIQLYSKLKKIGLSRAEYRHIHVQLKEAHKKIKELNKYYGKVRSIRAFKQLYEMNRLAKRIFSIVKHHPKKFYDVESFFYAHLDSALELTSKYSLLVSQPLKDSEIKLSLQQTRDTLESLNDVMENDLRNVLSSDINELKMELDFAKISLNKKNKPLLMEGDLPHDGKTTNSK